MRHNTLLRMLQTSYGFDGIVINKWLTSYLSGSVQYVQTPTTTSSRSPVVHEVPQRSVLRPILFLLYVADMLKLMKRHQLIPHVYADDIKSTVFLGRALSTAQLTECRPVLMKCRLG